MSEEGSGFLSDTRCSICNILKHELGPIRTLLTNTLSMCLAFCVLSPSCKAVNYCGDRICELSFKDFYDDGELIEASPQCVFRGMQRNTAPLCSEMTHNDTLKDIQDDKDPGLCRINKKRSDAFITIWVSVGDSTFVDGAIVYLRECRPALHGGARVCAKNIMTSGQTALISLHNHTKLNALDASNFCKAKNFFLWDGVYWNAHELQWIADNMGTEEFLVGVSDTQTEGVWLDLNEDEVTDLITWKSGQSNNAGNLDQLVADASLLREKNINAFYASTETFESYFVCLKFY